MAPILLYVYSKFSICFFFTLDLEVSPKKHSFSNKTLLTWGPFKLKVGK